MARWAELSDRRFNSTVGIVWPCSAEKATGPATMGRMVYAKRSVAQTSPLRSGSKRREASLHRTWRNISSA